MKRFTLIALIGLVGVLVIPACKKYEDGPYLSFVSRKERITNSWKIDKVFKNDEDITVAYKTDFPNLIWEFAENGDLQRTYDVAGIGFTTNGHWGLQSDDEELALHINDALIMEEYIWIIQKLMQDDLRVTYVNGKDTYEYRFIPSK